MKKEGKISLLLILIAIGLSVFIIPFIRAQDITVCNSGCNYTVANFVMALEYINDTNNNTIYLNQNDSLYVINYTRTYNIRHAGNDTSNSTFNINASGVNLDCNNSILQGDGNGYGFYIKDLKNITIKRCEFKFYNENWINNSINLSLLDNKFIDIPFGLNITTLNDGYIFRNNFTNNTRLAIYFGYTENDTYSNINLSYNIFENNGRDYVTIFLGYANFSNIYIRYNNASFNQNFITRFAAGPHYLPLINLTISNNNITNNYNLKSNGDSIILIEGCESKANISIYNNYFYNNTGPRSDDFRSLSSTIHYYASINLNNRLQCKDFRIYNNTFIKSSGIRIDDNNGNVTIENNTFKDLLYNNAIKISSIKLDTPYTNDSVIIRNNSIFGPMTYNLSGSFNNISAIYVISSRNVFILNNTITNFFNSTFPMNSSAIYIRGNYTNVTGNLINNASNGIIVDGGYNNYIANNTITNVSINAIEVRTSSFYNTISNNTIRIDPGFANNGSGILMTQSDANNISKTQISGFKYGLRINLGYNNTFTSINLSNNTFNLYLDNVNDLLLNYTTFNDSYIFTDSLTIYRSIQNTAYTNKEIFICFLCNATNISDSTLRNNSHGVILWKSNYSNVGSNITLNDLSTSGVTSPSSIYLYFANNNTLKYINSNGTVSGIRLDNSLNNTITDSNITSSSNYGIFLNSSNLTVINNVNISDSAWNGIDINYSNNIFINYSRLKYNVNGISEVNSTGIIVNRSEISSNRRSGIKILHSTKHNITNNILSNNSGWGINMSENTDSNLIDNFTIIKNNTVDGIYLKYISNVNITDNNITYAPLTFNAINNSLILNNTILLTQLVFNEYSNNNLISNNTIFNNITTTAHADALTCSFSSSYNSIPNNITGNIIFNGTVHPCPLTNLWLNHFYTNSTQYIGTVMLGYTSINVTLCINGEGNFYLEGAFVNRTMDCGVMNVTNPLNSTNQSSPININWTRQSAKPEYTVYYNLYYTKNRVNSSYLMSYSPIFYNNGTMDINFSMEFRVYNAGLTSYINISGDNTGVNDSLGLFNGINSFNLWLLDLPDALVRNATLYVPNTTADTCESLATTYNGVCYLVINNSFRANGYGNDYTFTPTLNSTFKVMPNLGFQTTPSVKFLNTSYISIANTTSTNYNWNYAGLSDGNLYLVKVMPFVLEGATQYNATSSFTSNLTLDGSGPTAELSSPTSATLASSVDISCSASDAYSEVASTDITVDGSSLCSSTTSCSGTYVAATTGDHEVKCTAKDSFNNTNEQSVTLNVYSSGGGGGGGDGGTTAEETPPPEEPTQPIITTEPVTPIPELTQNDLLNDIYNNLVQDIGTIPITTITPDLAEDALTLSLDDKAKIIVSYSSDSGTNTTKPRISISFNIPGKPAKELKIRVFPLKKTLLWMIIVLILIISYVYYRYRKER